MIDRRKKNVNWYIADNSGNLYGSGAQLAVLMDIRDELQKLNALLQCENFKAIPRKLDRISRNTTKKQKARRKLAGAA